MTIFTMLLVSFIFMGLAGGIYPFLCNYICEFSKWYRWVAAVFWISYFSGIILAIISFVSLTKGAI